MNQSNSRSVVVTALAAFLFCISARGQQPWAASGSSIYYNGGNVGIGTSTPFYPGLQVGGGGAGGGQYVVVNGGTGTAGGGAIAFGANATPPFTTAVGQYSAIYGGTLNKSLTLYSNGANVLVPFGNVGIGIMNPQNALSVNGTVEAQEVIVQTNVADYVFAADYSLRPLSQVASYIKKNHHLPDIPSEAEAKEKGVSVGRMEEKLLAQIEELTLRMIQMDKENKALNERLYRLEKH